MGIRYNSNIFWSLLINFKFVRTVNGVIAVVMNFFLLLAFYLLPKAEEWFAERDKQIHDLIIRHCYTYFWWLLSVWSILSNSFFFNLYTIIDIFEFYSKKYPQNQTYPWLKEKTQIVAGYMLFTVTFPLTLLVVLTFWYLCYLNSEGIYPVGVHEYIDAQLNHVMHTYPLFIVLALMMLSNEYVPPKRHAKIGLIGVMLTYFTGLLGLRYVCGEWVYKILGELPTTQLLSVFLFCAINTLTNVHIAYYLNDRIQEFKERIRMSAKKNLAD